MDSTADVRPHKRQRRDDSTPDSAALDTRKGLTFVRGAWAQHQPTRPFCPSVPVPGTGMSILQYCTCLVKLQLHKRQRKADRSRHGDSLPSDAPDT